MTSTPSDVKYTKTHEWARVDQHQNVVVGISDYAQDALGDVVFVELPETGMEVTATEEAGVVESVKAASDIYAPIGGVIVDANKQLESLPELLNTDPYQDGWIFVIQPQDLSELDELLDAETYVEFCEAQGDNH